MDKEENMNLQEAALEIAREAITIAIITTTIEKEDTALQFLLLIDKESLGLEVTTEEGRKAAGEKKNITKEIRIGIETMRGRRNTGLERDATGKTPEIEIEGDEERKN